MAESIDLIFRQEYARLTAFFVARYGVDCLEMIEDALQEAFLKAVKIWPHKKTENPVAWLRTVARNALLDQFRKNKNQEKLWKESMQDSPETDLMDDQEVMEDAQLRMLFACCSPDLRLDDQLVLSLRYLCGLGNHEIARGLGKSYSAVEKAVFRAKNRFRELNQNLEISGISKLKSRVPAVLKVLYLQFTEGYKQTRGEQLIDEAICLDAIQMGRQLTRYPELHLPEVDALLALMCFQASRLEARIGEEGQLLRLQEQNRERWDQELIRMGNQYLNRGARGSVLSRYHLEAGIAALWCAAPEFSQTDFEGILSLYDLALIHFPNPHYRLNRLIVLSELRENGEVLAELERQWDDLPENSVRLVFKGDLLSEAGQSDLAALCYEEAKKIVATSVEKRFLEDKIMALFR